MFKVKGLVKSKEKEVIFDGIMKKGPRG